jgi:ssDNA-binding Zn-finger/Zn-ribbon topoisomerase 1
MPVVQCPDCGAVVELPRGVRPGDLVGCPNCAGHALRVREVEGRWSATLAHRVSCPNCDEVLTLPEDTKPGDFVQCCGRSYRLTFEYGTFAAEAREEGGDVA